MATLDRDIIIDPRTGNITDVGPISGLSQFGALIYDNATTTINDSNDHILITNGGSFSADAFNWTAHAVGDLALILRNGGIMRYRYGGTGDSGNFLRGRMEVSGSNTIVKGGDGGRTFTGNPSPPSGDVNNAATTFVFAITADATENPETPPSLRIVGNGPHVLQLAGQDANATLPAISLEGNTSAEVPGWLGIPDLQVSPTAINAQLDNNGVYNGVSYGYAYRGIHQGSPSNNVSFNDTDDSTVAEYLPNIEIGGQLVGNTAQFGDTTRTSIFQINRRHAMWLVGPTNNGVRWTTGDPNLLVGFHNSNPPDTSAGAAEIRTFVPDRVSFLDIDENPITAFPTKVTYFEDNTLTTNAEVREIIDYDFQNLPPRVAPTFGETEVVVNNNEHRGVIIDSSRTYYVSKTTSTARDPGSGTNQVTPPSNTFHRITRNFRYDFERVTGVGTGVEKVFGSLTNYTPSSSIATQDWDSWLNNRTFATAPLNGVNDMADILPSIRASHYSGSTNGASPVSLVENVLTFDRRVEFGSSDDTSWTATTASLATLSPLTNSSNVNTSFGFGANTVDFNGTAFPTGQTFVGSGTFEDFSISNLNNNTFVDNPSIEIYRNEDLSAISFTGNVTIISDVAYTVTITQAQADDGVTNGGTSVTNNQVVGNITYNVVAEVVNVSVSPAGDLADIRTLGGYWRVIDNTGAVVQTHNITNTTTLDDITFTRSNTVSTSFRTYYLPLSTSGGRTFDYGNGMWTPSVNGDAVVNALEDTALSSHTSLTPTYTNSNVSVNGSGTGANTTVRAVINPPTITGITSAQAAEIAIVIRNSEDYIQAVIQRDYDEDERTVEFAQPFITHYNGVVGGAVPTPNRNMIELRLHDDITANVGIANTEGYVSIPNLGNFTIFNSSVIQPVTPLSGVTQALEDSPTLQNVNNITSYLVTDGDPVNPQLDGLVAVKSNTYNNNTDYTQATE